MEPLEFTLALRDFDLYLLPDDARQVGSDRFKAEVARFYAEQFTPLGGSTAVVIDDDTIHVAWTPEGVVQDPLGYALDLLRSGRLKEAVPLLETLRQMDADDTDVLYNLGMAFSDLGELDKAKQHLTRLVEIDPRHANGWVALGVARQRSGDSDGALVALQQAVLLEPENGYAHRNLGAMLGQAGQAAEALQHLRRAAELLPDDLASLFGLAQVLEETGEHKDLEEADDLYVRIIQRSPNSQIGELAKRSRSRIAQSTMRERVGDGPNMAGVMYCLSALQRFAKLPVNQVKQIAMEIAILGQSGFDTNDSTPKYHLRTVTDGPFSGLQMVSMMYVGFKQIAPGADIGFDLSEEYRLALQMHESGSQT